MNTARRRAEADPVVVRATAGDRDARRELLERHGALVYSLCRRTDPSPDDCYQEVWEKVFRALHRFDPHGAASIRTWLVTVTHRHLIDRQRRRRVRGEVVSLDELPPVDPDADARISQRQRQARLEAALARLPEAQRRVVVLHHLQGVSLDELADREGVAVGTIKSRLHRGRARLAEWMGGAP